MKDDVRTREMRLYFLGDPDDAARAGLRLTTWLGNLFADRPRHQERRERIKEIAEAANDSRNWKHDVSMLLNPVSQGACRVAMDALFFDALTVRAVAALASRRIRLRQGIEKILNPGVSDSIYNGIELIAFPPDLGQDAGDSAYVINVSTATFPEKPDVYGVAHYSIRNRGKVKPRLGGGSRKLDVFLPPVADLGKSQLFIVPSAAHPETYSSCGA